MSFLKDQIESGAVEIKADEEVKSEIKTEEIKADEVITDTKVEEEIKSVEDVKVDEEVKADAVEDAAPSKVEVDYQGWLTENEGTILQYLREKNTDYSTLPKEDLVRLKLKQDNPHFSDEDVSEELADRYGLGLKPVTIDEDNMTVEEIEEAKRENKKLQALQARGSRLIKTDAAQAAKFFEDQKAGITLPKFEIDAPKVEKAVFNEDAYTKQVQDKAQEYKEKNWIPTLQKVIDPLESITEQVEYEDNGNKVVLDVNYKLSKDEKDAVLQDLADYMGKPSDEQYVDAQGNPDVQRFVQDRVKELNFKKLLKTVAKEAAALARKEFVKNDLINFSDDGKQRGVAEKQEQDFATSFFGKASSTKKQL